jgi:hypothetical protein
MNAKVFKIFVFLLFISIYGFGQALPKLIYSPYWFKSGAYLRVDNSALSTSDTLWVKDGGIFKYRLASTLGGASTWTVSGNDQYSNVSGNVGIGTTMPNSKLQVSGYINFVPILNNTYIGKDIGMSNTTGKRNTALGRNAMYSVTTGSNNTAIGNKALYSNLTTNESVAIGDSALYSNLKAGMTAIGFRALGSNTNGTDNTALGRAALAANTIGSNNIAIGEYTLYMCTQASWNIAIGNTAMQLTNTDQGQQNIAIGHGAMLMSNAAQKSIAIGNASGYMNTAPYQNISIGHESAYNNTDQYRLFIEPSNADSANALIFGVFSQDANNSPRVTINGSLNIKPLINFPTHAVKGDWTYKIGAVHDSIYIYNGTTWVGLKQLN